MTQSQLMEQEFDETWLNKIRQQKFQWHNSEWLQYITAEKTGSLGDESEFERDGEDESLDGYLVQKSRGILAS